MRWLSGITDLMHVSLGNFHVFRDPPSLCWSGLHVQPGEAQGPLRRTDSLLLMVSWCPARARLKWKFPAALPT